MPLHVFVLWFMGIFASLRAAGVYFLALELTGKVRWACLATAMFAFLPANYHTIGFLLMREDFSFPFFALHLALLARAARLRTTPSMLLCVLPLVAALASWQAMYFFVSLELACLFLWYLRTGENPFDVPGAWIVPATAAVLSLFVPLFWRTGFLVGLPMRLALGLLAASLLRRRGIGRWAAAGAALGIVAAITLFQAALGPGGGDYDHVWKLMVAKARFLGERPPAPSLLSFEARMMWQGPFTTLEIGTWLHFFGAALLLSIPAFAQAVPDAIRGERAAETLAVALATAGLLCSWLVGRVMPLPGMLLPVCSVLALSRIRGEHAGIALMGVAVLAQSFPFQRVIAEYRIPWYEPPFLTLEFRELVSVLPALVPVNEAVLADPVVSTAILAHTRRPIVLQPKWEEAEARRRFREFVETFFHGTPDALRSLMLERYRCRYLLVDRYTLWQKIRYIAGIPPGQPAPDAGTAASFFLGPDPPPPESLPGYRLIYRSPPSIAAGHGGVPEQIRLYEVSR